LIDCAEAPLENSPSKTLQLDEKEEGKQRRFLVFAEEKIKFSVALSECSSRFHLHTTDKKCLCRAGECKELKVLCEVREALLACLRWSQALQQLLLQRVLCLQAYRFHLKEESLLMPEREGRVNAR